MHKVLSTIVLVTGALNLNAQQIAKKTTVPSFDVAVTFSLERAQIAQTGSPSFWLKGGSLSGSVSLYKRLGVAANLTTEHASNIAPGVNLGKTSYMFGPRYTVDTSKYTNKLAKGGRATVFGEWLFGGVHAYDSLFPSGTTTKSSANAFSMQVGGGFDIALRKGLGIRPIELDYVHTNLSNNAANSQNDVRIGFGVSYRR